MARTIPEIVADFEKLTTELRSALEPTPDRITTPEQFQAALTAAQPGQAIELQPGIVYAGTFRVPSKVFDPPVTIRTAGTLPERRVTPADRTLMATIVSLTNDGGLRFENTTGWRVEGVDFQANPGGNGDVLVVQNASAITVDRVLFEAPGTGQKRFMRGNGRSIVLTRSHVAGVWKAGQDSQAFCAWDGAGPFTIVDNYLEAASENIMFGGADSASAENVPADILIEGNTIRKPRSWQGQRKVIKNLIEFKAALRVVIRQNVIEGIWSGEGQSGYAVVFTVRNQDGRAPWSATQDVLFEQNIIRDAERGIVITGYDTNFPSGQTTGIRIQHNLIVTSADALQIGSEVGELTIDHNTFINGSTPVRLVRGDVWPASENLTARRAQRVSVMNFVYTNNIAYHRQYGVMGEGAGGSGTNALTKMTGQFEFRHNVLAGASVSLVYPESTLKTPVSLHTAQFAEDGYTLKPDSLYVKAGTDGTNLGM